MCETTFRKIIVHENRAFSGHGNVNSLLY